MRDPSEVIAAMKAFERKFWTLAVALNDRSCDHDVCKEVRDFRAAVSYMQATSAAMQCVGTLGASLASPQPASADVDDAMVERALDYYYDNSPFTGPDELKAAMRGCLLAAIKGDSHAG